MKKLINLSMIAIALSFTACQAIPKGAKPVTNFEAKKYIGEWYEIARLDFKFERNLNNTKAQYSLKDNGDIKVVNSGYNYVKNNWTEREGNAKFTGSDSIGALKVSFFGPFYSGYNVLAIDEAYKYALVAGKNLNYLWILSREKTIPNHVKETYLSKAKALGYNINDLVWVEHNK